MVGNLFPIYLHIVVLNMLTHNMLWW